MPSLARSAHLYGYPNYGKLQKLKPIVKLYKEQTNFFIDQLIHHRKYWLDIFNNNNQSSRIRQLEKQNRTSLGSAYGQNCIDDAVVKLHNHFNNIRNDLYGYFIKRGDLIYLVKSLGMLNACLLDEDLLETLNYLIDRTTNEDTNEFYQETKEVLNGYTDVELQEMKFEVRRAFLDELMARKTPRIKKVTIQLDSRVGVLEKSNSIEADYVIRVKTLNYGEKIEIPLNTSTNNVRRLNQYPSSKSVTLKIIGKKIKVSVPFHKKVQQKTYKNNLIGVDIGITDLIYDSEGNSFGSIAELQDYYNQTVQKKVKNRRNLANKMRQYQKELKKPTTSQKRKEYLREKIFNISRMLQGKNKLSRTRRAYKHKRDFMVAKAVKEFIKQHEGEKITVVLEDIDIVNFDNKDKKRNQKFSMWIRGRLMKKLVSKLSWNSISTKKVLPDYTSQLCPECNHLDQGNRNGKSFICNVCGYEEDADKNAADNIKMRAYDPEIESIEEEYRYATHKRHEALKELYQERHEKYCSKSV